MHSPDWKTVTNLLVQNHRNQGYGYVSPVQLWTPEDAPDITIKGKASMLVDVGPEDLVLSGREVTQKQLRRWLWDIRECRALSPQRIGRSVVWHFWDQEAGESAFSIAAFTRYDAGERLNRMRREETVTNG